MNIKLEVLYKNDIDKTANFKIVNDISNSLFEFLNNDIIQNKIKETHKTHAKSGEIQEILLSKAIELGFTSEKKGLFKDYPSNGLRPDYYKSLGLGKGVIMEVERGKTTTNNMDMLDMWKCHICKDANYLFLIIPQYRQTEKGKNTPIFSNVIKRLKSFYFEDNYINIDGVFIFGY